MNIAILLPYKENFIKKRAGAVSIFVSDTTKLSNYKKNIKVYGYTSYENKLKNYINLYIRQKFLRSTSLQYLNKFLVKIKDIKIDIIEVHNRPNYINFLDKNHKSKKILYFHNDPKKMLGSRTISERINLLKKTDTLIFNSNWTKLRFLENLPNNIDYKKIIIIPQCTSKTKINFDKKKNLISFIGKLNKAKGYDIFGKSVLKILDKYPNWKSVVIGDERREKIFFKHKNLKFLGYKSNSYILNKLKEVAISVVPSKWDEPFGRSSMEAASRGSALIISNSGGLSETTKNSLVIKNVTVDNLYKKIKYLIDNKQYRKKLQQSAHKNFILTNKHSSNLFDTLRSSLLTKNININFNKNEKLKIFHITNFNERFNGRLHYNTSKRINNGLIKLGHNIFSISDRDIISNYKSLLDPSGKNILNNKIIESCKNFNPDTIIMGHADSVKTETLDYLKNKNKNLKICQWFLDPITKYGPDYVNNKNRLLKSAKFIDASFITTDPNSIDFNLNNSYFIPNPVDESFETLKNYEENPKNDLFFAMSHGVHRGTLKTNKIDKREKLLNKLLNKNKKIKFDFYGYGNKQPIWGDDFINVLSNSKMGLNLSRGKPIKYYSSDRLTQLMGNGLLTFIDEKTCYSDFFTNKEIVTYKNYDDLIEKIYKYKRNDKERKLIGRNGKSKYFKYFNSTLVAEFIINKTYDIKKKYYWENIN
jgi:glycosyltransferase involved in cell wall biosynthesis